MPNVIGALGARMNTNQAAGTNEAVAVFQVCLANESGMVTTANELAVDLGAGGVLSADRVVTAATGTTPSATVIIQTSSDNGVLDAFTTSHTFTAATAAGAQNVTAIVKRYVRVGTTITGTTPSFDFKVTGEIAR